MADAPQTPHSQTDVAASDIVSSGGFGSLTPDSVAYGLKVGDRWGAYWLHPDGMMRLYAPDL